MCNTEAYRIGKGTKGTGSKAAQVPLGMYNFTLMKNKISLITGANSGIGFELAKGMAKQDYKTILLCRNRKTGEIAKNEIIKASNNKDVHLMIADLSSQLSIREFVNKLNIEYDHLDVLFNNAGANFFEHQLSVDNIEMTFATNYLAPFLLTNLLLPKLEKSNSGKIILTVGSIRENMTINYDDINFENNYNIGHAAAQAILAKFLFCYELDRKLKDSPITINCFHPGATKTNLQKKMPFMWRIMIGITRPFFKSAEKGAATGIYLATAKELENTSGRYFKNKKEIQSTKISYDLEIAKRLWELSEAMTEKSKINV